MMALQTGSLVGLLPLLPLLALHRACGPCGVWTKAAAKIKALEAAPDGGIVMCGVFHVSSCLATEFFWANTAHPPAAA